MNIFKKSLFLPLFLLCFISGSIQAADIKGLYSLSLLVPEQSSVPSDEQMRSGLRAVLVKAAGQRQLMGSPVIQQALDNAASYLRSYAYNPTNRAIVDKQGTEQPAQRLKLEYDEALINVLLKQAGASPLGTQRPTLMVWVAAERNDGFRDYVSSDSFLLAPLQQASVERALPLQMPLLDLTDQQILPLSDLWGLFDDGIKRASVRYRPDAVLAGRMTEITSGNWAIDWVLINSAKVERFTTEGPLDLAMSQSLEQVSNKLLTSANLGTLTAAESVSGYRQQGIYLDISNIRNLNDYVVVTDYIRNLSVVADAHPAEIDGNTLLFRLELQGSLDQLQQALKLEPRLSVLEGAVSEVGESATVSLRLRWQG